MGLTGTVRRLASSREPPPWGLWVGYVGAEWLR